MSPRLEIFKLFYYTFSTSEVIFPEVTVCPNFLEHTHKWKYLCEKFNVCDQEQFSIGNIFPENKSMGAIELSEYYDDATYKLNELISLFEIETDLAPSDDSSRY